MHKPDRYVLTVLSLLTLVITFHFSADFNLIASESINLVSFALAVYSVALGALAGDSELAKSMRSTVDPKSNGEQTEQGTLNSYIRCALLLGCTTIIVATLIIVLHDERWLRKLYYFAWGSRVIGLKLTYRILSSIGFTLFACNFFFMYRIIQFILNRITWNK